jgi:ferritin-like metal-binding protein YciE
MTNQEKKRYLQRYTKLKNAIDQKLSEYEQLRALCERATTTITGMPPSGRNSREDAYVRMIEMGDKINDEIDRYVDMRGEIEAAISTVEDITLQTLLRYRYLEGFTWEKVAVELNYCWRQIIRLHGRALQDIKL